MEKGEERRKYVQLLSGVFVAMFLIRVAFGIVVITFGHFVTANDFIFGLLVSSAPLLELVTVVFVGVFVDRYGRKGVLLAGLAMGAFSLYALALVRGEQYILLGLVNAIHGIAAAFILVTTLAIIASVTPPANRGREMGLFNFANMFGWIFGFALGSALLDVFHDLRYTFVLAGFLATLGLAYGHFSIHEPPRHRPLGEEKGHMKDLAMVFSNPRLLVLAGAWLIVFIFVGALITFFSRVTTGDRVLDFSGSQVAFWILVVGGGFMASQLLFGKLSDKFGREPIMLVGSLGFLGLMLTVLAGYLGAESPEALDVFASLASRGTLLAFFGFVSLSFAPAGLAALADEATEKTEGTTMSLYSLVLNLGMIVGPPSVGAIATSMGGPGVLGAFLVLAVLLFALVSLRMVQMKRDPASKATTVVPGR